jgi:N-acetylmuramoyl-L-alanine amidase
MQLTFNKKLRPSRESQLKLRRNMRHQTFFRSSQRNMFFAVFLLFGLTLAHATQQKFHAVRLGGQDYVPLADWARANDLKWHWLEWDKKVEATNRATRLVLEVNSAEADINGVRVRLSSPFAVSVGVPLIAQLDLDTTIDPLLFPPHFDDARPIKTICLDPGHGGKDSGNRVGRHYEKNYTLPLGLDLRRQLRQAGFHVIMTRTTDRYVSLSDRAAFANRHGADLFVSLHFNATPTGRDEAEGPETYCITPVGAHSSDQYVERSETGPAIGDGPTTGNRNEDKSLLLAYQVEKSLVQNLDANDRGVKRARFEVLRDTTMPAILIEGGFMSNPVEGKKIYSAAYRRRMAAAIVKGILAYQRLSAPSVNNSYSHR